MNELDLRVIKTKEKIYNAFLECLSLYPFKKITVNKLVERAHINRTTFYKYYLDKFDLLDCYLKDALEIYDQNMNSDFINAPKTDINNSIYSHYFKHILMFFQKNSHIYEVLWRVELERNIYQEMLGMLQVKLNNMILTDPYYDETKRDYALLYAQLFSYSCMITIRWWIEQCPKKTIEEVEFLMKSNMESGFFQTYRTLIESR